MKVKLLSGMVRVGPDRRQVSHSPGEVVEVPADEADRLIAGGMALALPEPIRQAQDKPKPAAKTTRTKRSKK